MLIIKTLFIVFLFASLTTTLAISSASEGLNIQLQQAVDANCDGFNDQPYSRNKPLSILPQQCLMYKINIKNRSKETLYKLILKGKIPLNTQFKPKSLLVYKEDILQHERFVQVIDKENITIKLTALDSLKQLTLFYAIVIN